MQTPKKKTNLSVSTMLFVGVLGVLIGVGGAAGFSVLLSEPAKAVNVVCESFVGPKGPSGADGVDGVDGKDGYHGTVTFKHDPDLLGLFSEQNVKIETHPID
jgi:hypothetical protein